MKKVLSDIFWSPIFPPQLPGNIQFALGFLTTVAQILCLSMFIVDMNIQEDGYGW